MSTKIPPSHLQRDAYVYVRQSTGHHVRSHPESQRRQYALAEHARGLGFAQVIVIDEDVGRQWDGTPRASRLWPIAGGRVCRAGRGRLRLGSLPVGAQQPRLASSHRLMCIDGDLAHRR